jgi:hypothetical protein
MGLYTRGRKTGLLGAVMYVVPPLLLSVLFFYLSINEISLLQLSLAIALLVMPWTYYLKWKQRRETGLPIFAIISFMYWIYYALSLFWGARTLSGDNNESEMNISGEMITAALEMAVFGVVAMWFGMKMGLSRHLIPKKVPLLKNNRAQTQYVRMVLVVTSLLGLSEQFAHAAGEGAKQMLTIIVTLLPIVAFCILFHAYLRGESSLVDKLLIAGFLLSRFIIGLASGWLGSFASIVVICGAVYLLEKRKVPRVAVLLVIIFTLFFQVGKREFRETYWQGGTEASKIERVKFWAETSLNKWGDAFTDPTGLELNEALNASLSRMSLLTQTANVVDKTPRVVPYQFGHLYAYMIYTLIPRFIWPNKPSVSDANRFYQVAYGLSGEDALDSVAIGVGTMPEAYISFGWFGVLGIMFLLGIFYDVYQRTFFAKSSGGLMFCIGVALIPQMIGIEAQMAGYLGGILQQVLLTLIIFLPVIRLSKKSLDGAVTESAAMTVPKGLSSLYYRQRIS